jgi:hypothetical protein
MEYMSEQESKDLIDSVFFSYWLKTLGQYKDMQSLEIMDLARSDGENARLLTRLFNAHGIGSVPMTTIGSAYDIAKQWLETGVFHSQPAAAVSVDINEQLQRLAPVIADIVNEGRGDENLFGTPLVLASLGNAGDILNKLQEWKENGNADDAAFRQRVAKTLTADQADPGANGPS